MKNVLTDSCSMETALRHCPYLQCFKNYNEKITLMIKFFALYFKQRKQTYKNWTFVKVRFTLCVSSCDSFDKAWKTWQNLFWQTETEHNKYTMYTAIYDNCFERSTLFEPIHADKHERKVSDFVRCEWAFGLDISCALNYLECHSVDVFPDLK